MKSGLQDLMSLIELHQFWLDGSTSYLPLDRIDEHRKIDSPVVQHLSSEFNSGSNSRG